MKKLLFTLALSHFGKLSIALLSFVNCPSSLNAQTIPPPFINYQAVLYDVNGANPNSPLTNQSFSTFVNINDELGNLLYREEHYASTDANGLITVKMGDGLYTAGPITNFNQINWGVGKYYLVVDFNINGTISSTAPEQLVTVPYSFYAGNAGNGMTAVADNGNGTLTFTYANGQTYITPALSGMTGPVGPAGAQGIPGTNGATGATGQNGLNALIKTTSEAAGANCTNGGTKIETGLDANGNGVLDAGEVNVSQTQYVCNGAGSSVAGGVLGNVLTLCADGPRWTPNGKCYDIGDTLGCGIVAYVFQAGDPGYVIGEIHGILVSFQSYGPLNWGCYGTSIPGTSQGLGSGVTNSNLIVNSCPTAGIMAHFSLNLSTDGCGDWVLPSWADLQKIYAYRNLIGINSFPTGNVLSSSEYDSSGQLYAFGYTFPNHFGGNNLNKNSAYVRPIRYF